ncbi:MAG: hypothetical protein ACI31V_01715 [Bacilli bacterium]
MDIDELKSIIKNDLLFILDNREKCIIEVSDTDINNVYSLLESDDYDILLECHNEMDDIVNGIVINIDSRLKELLDLSLGVCDRMNILNEIISISNSIRYNSDNKAYFMGMIKKIYDNIEGDEL